MHLHDIELLLVLFSKQQVVEEAEGEVGALLQPLLPLVHVPEPIVKRIA